jgi:hypothetical protein
VLGCIRSVRCDQGSRSVCLANLRCDRIQRGLGHLPAKVDGSQDDMECSLPLYGRAVGILGASSGAAFAALCPAMTALLGIPILGELPGMVDWAAICLISAGVYIVSGGPLPRLRIAFQWSTGLKPDQQD